MNRGPGWELGDVLGWDKEVVSLGIVTIFSYEFEFLFMGMVMGTSWGEMYSLNF